MKFLLDTHALIWALYDYKQLPPRVQQQIESRLNEIFFSSISSLEISVKILAKKLTLNINELLKEAIYIGFEEFPFTSKHAEFMTALPVIHTDPFDRALIAQAQVESLTLVTKDKNIKKYPLSQIW